MVGMFDNMKDWEIAEEMGVANYGQMTAGRLDVHRSAGYRTWNR